MHVGKESFTFRGANGQEVYTWHWNVPPEVLRGVIQIFHGMAEHAGRYEDFAEHLNARGFAVYACDQRGHGRTGEMNGSLNHLDRDGFNGILEDQRLLAERIGEKHPGIPVFVVAHSFGSFVAQEYIKRYGGDISGLILSGSSMMKGPEVKAGYVLAALSLLMGARRPNVLIDRLSFGSYNKAIRNPAGKFSWLSRDEVQVGKYEADRFCGNVMSTRFYYCFFKGLNRLYRASGLEKIPKNLPVFIISGGDDPVGKYGTGVRKLQEWYQSLGMQDLQVKLYNGGRHEIINETNRSEVFNDISDWLLKRSST